MNTSIKKLRCKIKYSASERCLEALRAEYHLGKHNLLVGESQKLLKEYVYPCDIFGDGWYKRKEGLSTSVINRLNIEKNLANSQEKIIELNNDLEKLKKIDDLQTISHTDTECPVCFEKIISGYTLNCTHKFCKDCLEKSLCSKNSCPSFPKQLLENL